MRNVCGIIVAYNPLPALIGEIKQLKEQACEVVVVDNGTYASWPVALKEAVKTSGLTLLQNPDNLGVATAFNQGFRYALEKGYSWAATFDQDSTPPTHFISGLFAALESCPLGDKVAVVAPRYWLKDTPTPTPATSTAPAWKTVPVAMASGNLVRLEAAESVGMMDETFFIDYVDFDFCLRLKQKGWQIIQAANVWLPHHLGSRQKHRCLGISFSLVSHSPLRRYYNTRNRWITYRRHATRFPGWFFHDLIWWGLEVMKILFFEKQKSAKFRAMARGLEDARRGRMGPAPASLIARLQTMPNSKNDAAGSLSHG